MAEEEYVDAARLRSCMLPEVPKVVLVEFYKNELAFGSHAKAIVCQKRMCCSLHSFCSNIDAAFKVTFIANPQPALLLSGADTMPTQESYLPTLA